MDDPLKMSVPSSNSVESVYGSCAGSDTDSILSYQTFRSVRSGSFRSASMKSGSTNFYSDESDTDTLVNEDTTSEDFYDVIDETFRDVTAANRISNLEPEDEEAIERSELEESDESSLSTQRAPSTSPSQSTELTETDQLLEERANPVETLSTASSKTLTSVQNSTTIQDAPVSGQVQSPPSPIFDYHPVNTLIQTRARPPQRPTPAKKVSRLKSLTMPLYCVFLLVWTLLFQTLLRFNSGLNNWTLVFWRSIFQFFISIIFLISTKKSPFGSRGSRLLLLSHGILSSMSVFSMLFSAERLNAGDLAAIYLNVPLLAMLFQIATRRGSLRSHVSLFVLLFWVCSVLLLTRTTPWPSLWPQSNHTKFQNLTSASNITYFEQTSFENASRLDENYFDDSEALFDDGVTSLINRTTFTESNSTVIVWLPPLFGLDNIHLWPVQPSVFDENGNFSEYQHTLMEGNEGLYGLAVGILGLISSAVLPGVTSLCPSDIIVPIMLWQAVGAFLTSLTGILLHSGSFLFGSVTEWIFATLIVFMGSFGNLGILKFLTTKQGQPNEGWANFTSFRFIPVITIGVLARSAFEIVIIFGINFSSFSSCPVSIEDGLGMGFLVLIGILCCIVKPVTHGRDSFQPAKNSSTSIQ